MLTQAVSVLASGKRQTVPVYFNPIQILWIESGDGESRVVMQPSGGIVTVIEPKFDELVKMHQDALRLIYGDPSSGKAKVQPKTTASSVQESRA